MHCRVEFLCFDIRASFVIVQMGNLIKRNSSKFTNNSIRAEKRITIASMQIFLPKKFCTPPYSYLDMHLLRSIRTMMALSILMNFF